MPEPMTTKALNWAHAKAREERLPEHELRCIECGERSEAPVCVTCTEHHLEAEVIQ